MNDLAPQVKIADPSDKEYKRFIRYFTKCGGGGTYEDKRSMVFEAAIDTTKSEEINKENQRLALVLLGIVTRIDMYASECGKAVCDLKTYDNSFISLDDVGGTIKKLEDAGLIFHDKKDNTIALTKGAVEFLSIIINKIDDKNNVEKKDRKRFTMSQIRFVDPSVLGQDGKGAVAYR